MYSDNPEQHTAYLEGLKEGQENAEYDCNVRINDLTEAHKAEIKELEESHQSKIETMEHDHSTEIQRVYTDAKNTVEDRIYNVSAAGVYHIEILYEEINELQEELERLRRAYFVLQNEQQTTKEGNNETISGPHEERSGERHRQY